MNLSSADKRSHDVNQPQDIQTDDKKELALRERLLRRQFYICMTERVLRSGDAMADLKPLMSEHLAWISGLEDSGIAFAAGPFRDNNDPAYWNGDGMFILRADSKEAAAAIADTCPFHSSGLRRYKIIPWWLNEGSIQLTVKLANKQVILG
jgi:uncharacterized protein YciI